MARDVEWKRAQAPETPARVAQRNFFAVDVRDAPAALLDGGRRNGYRCDDHIDPFESALELFGDETAHALRGYVTSGRKHQRLNVTVKQFRTVIACSRSQVMIVVRDQL